MDVIQVVSFLCIPILVGFVYWYQVRFHTNADNQQDLKNVWVESYLVVCSSLSIELICVSTKCISIPLLSLVIGGTMLTQIIGAIIIKRLVR